MVLVRYYVTQVKIVLIKTVYFVIIMGPFYFSCTNVQKFGSVSFFLKSVTFFFFFLLTKAAFFFNQKQYNQ